MYTINLSLYCKLGLQHNSTISGESHSYYQHSKSRTDLIVFFFFWVQVITIYSTSFYKNKLNYIGRNTKLTQANLYNPFNKRKQTKKNDYSRYLEKQLSVVYAVIFASRNTMYKEWTKHSLKNL